MGSEYTGRGGGSDELPFYARIQGIQRISCRLETRSCRGIVEGGGQASSMSLSGKPGRADYCDQDGKVNAAEQTGGDVFKPSNIPQK